MNASETKTVAFRTWASRRDLPDLPIAMTECMAKGE
jgi:hypothetical protein